MQTKDELRRELIRKLAALPVEEVEQASRTVAEKAFMARDWSKVQTILAYKPLPNSGEIDPIYLLEKLQGKQIGFVAAVKNAPFPTKQYDVIIVPVLGFDEQNYRLGRGGGWYDRFLITQPQALSLGLAHGISWVKNIPHTPYDLRLTSIIHADVATLNRT